MTKSRTLRKAAAVALSLAMAFSVATVSTDASAAAKPSLKKTSVSVKVKKSVKVGIKNYKLVKKVTVKVKNSKVASAKAVGKKAIKITGKKAGKTKVVVTIKYGKKTLKKNITVKVAKAKTDDDGTVVTESLKIVDNDGLQTDGTAVMYDELQVQIPASYGTIDRINWYVDDKLTKTSNSQGDGSCFYPSEPGTVIARVVTTKGTTYASDSIKVSDKEVRATVSGFTIEDDYDDKFVDLKPTDTKPIVTVTLNKLYAGNIEIYSISNGKLGDLVGTAYNTAAYDNDGDLVWYAKKSATQYTNHALYADNFTKPVITYDAQGKIETKGYGANYVKAADGSVTLKFFLEPQTGNNAKNIERGTEYVALFDQANVIDDDKNSATPNITDKVAAPYVTAPSKLAFEPISKGLTMKVDFVGEDGKALGWIGTEKEADGKTLKGDRTGIDSVKVFADKANTVSNKSTKFEKVGSNVKEGVITTATAAETGDFAGLGWYIAEAELTKGVFGKEKVTLTSAAANTNATIAEGAKVAPATDPHNAEIGFTNLRADAKVYLIKGTYDEKTKIGTAAADRVDKFDATNSSTYDFTADATKGAEKLTIEKVWESVSDPFDDEKDKANTYALVIMPVDETNFGRMQVTTDGGTTPKVLKIAQSVKSFALAKDYDFKQITAATGSPLQLSIGLDGQYKDGAASAYNVTGAANAIEVKDQFGNDIFVGDTYRWSNAKCALSGLNGIKTVAGGLELELKLKTKDALSADGEATITLNFQDGKKSSITVDAFNPTVKGAWIKGEEPTTGKTFKLTSYQATETKTRAQAGKKALPENDGTIYWDLDIA